MHKIILCIKQSYNIRRQDMKHKSYRPVSIVTMFLKKWWHLSILHRIFHAVELTFPSCLNRADAKNLLVCLFTVMFISCLIKAAWNLYAAFLEIVFLHLEPVKLYWFSFACKIISGSSNDKSYLCCKIGGNVWGCPPDTSEPSNVWGCPSTTPKPTGTITITMYVTHAEK